MFKILSIYSNVKFFLLNACIWRLYNFLTSWDNHYLSPRLGSSAFAVQTYLLPHQNSYVVTNFCLEDRSGLLIPSANKICVWRHFHFIHIIINVCSYLSLIGEGRDNRLRATLLLSHSLVVSFLLLVRFGYIQYTWPGPSLRNVNLFVQMPFILSFINSSLIYIHLIFSYYLFRFIPFILIHILIAFMWFYISS